MKHLLYTITLLLFLGSGHWSFGQSQQGQTIICTDTLNKGQSMAISADGKRMVIGADGDEGYPSNLKTSYVEVYELVGSTWNILGNTLEGSVLDVSSLGFSVDISDDGNRILVAGSVETYIFDWNGTDWSQVGDSIYRILHHGVTEIEMSGDGNSIVYGRTSNNTPHIETVEVFELNGNSWKLKGNVLTGTSGSLFGSAVSINQDGTIIAVGAQNGGTNGEVYVYEWSGSAWVQLGNIITADPLLITILFGEHLDLDSEGNRIAISAGVNATVYDFENGSWNQIGSNIYYGDATKYIYSIAICGQGDVIALGIDNFFSGTDVNVVYKLSDQNNWLKYGKDIKGKNDNDGFYSTAELNDDGSVLIAGSDKFYTSNNVFGYVKVYEMPEFCPWEIDPNYTLYGADSVDILGTEIAYSSNGEFLAVSTIYHDDNGTNAGQVKVFADIGGTWVQQGISLIGEGSYDRFGFAMDISNNGLVLAVGAYHNNDGGSNAGQVRVYLWNGTNYVQHGSDIDGLSANEELGYSISLSANGQHVAIGSPNNNDLGFGEGKVQVYKLTPSGIIPFLNPIYGQSAWDNAGECVIISDNGKRLAVGSPFNGDNGYHAGQVRVYNRVNNSWVQLGGDLNGEAADDLYGQAISLSANGLVVAIGARENDGNGSNAGHVRIFYYSNASQQWIQAGDDIDGEIDHHKFGSDLNLSKSGQRVVVTGRGMFSKGYENYESYNKVQVFDYVGSSWVQNENYLIGGNSTDNPGNSVKITGDGLKVAVGAPYSEEYIYQGGTVKIYETCVSNTKSILAEDGELFNQELEESIANQIEYNEINIFPNPVQNELSWKVDNQAISKIQIYNMQGQMVFEKAVNESKVNVEDLMPGAYFIKLMSDMEVLQKKFIKK